MSYSVGTYDRYRVRSAHSQLAGEHLLHNSSRLGSVLSVCFVHSHHASAVARLLQPLEHFPSVLILITAVLLYCISFQNGSFTYVKYQKNVHQIV